MSGAGGRLLAGCLLALLLAGCVERTLTVTSEPAGALVYVSSVEVGRTPVTLPFTWYGDYEIILRPQAAELQAGYRTLKTHYNVIPPLYDVPPLDLLSELAPWTYQVRRGVHFTLPKRVEPLDAELMERAEQLRGQALQDVEK